MAGELELRRDTDSWTEMLPAVGDLATKISGTDFVPKQLRGKPAAVAACILTGRELGIPPMQSLAGVFVVDGRPTLSAELMRQLVFAAGHRIRYIETTSTRCKVEGWRAGSESADGVVQWSMDDAKKAKLDGKENWRRHPRQMLTARATAELCRLVFPDVIGGLAYTPDELGDGGVVDAEVVEPVPVASGRRTARRKQSAEPQAEPEPEPQAEPVETVLDEPPLDDEPAGEPEPEPEPKPKRQRPPAAPKPVTEAQQKKLHALFGEVGWTDRDDRLRAASAIVGRSLTTSNDLTKDEASTLIDTLAQLAATDDPQGNLADLVAAVTAAEGADVDEDGIEDAEVVE